ncbi:MAG: hypothetical protein HRU19_17310 [Pseudobacteriovorax sp.]|nr:hypothetical protein [Pseudobacteriovorax sp.]
MYKIKAILLLISITYPNKAKSEQTGTLLIPIVGFGYLLLSKDSNESKENRSRKTIELEIGVYDRNRSISMQYFFSEDFLAGYRRQFLPDSKGTHKIDSHELGFQWFAFNNNIFLGGGTFKATYKREFSERIELDDSTYFRKYLSPKYNFFGIFITLGIEAHYSYVSIGLKASKYLPSSRTRRGDFSDVPFDSNINTNQINQESERYFDDHIFYEATLGIAI